MMVDPVAPPSAPRPENPAVVGSPTGFDEVLAAALTGSGEGRTPREGSAQETKTSDPPGGASSQEQLPRYKTLNESGVSTAQTSETFVPPADLGPVVGSQALFVPDAAPMLDPVAAAQGETLPAVQPSAPNASQVRIPDSELPHPSPPDPLVAQLSVPELPVGSGEQLDTGTTATGPALQSAPSSPLDSSGGENPADPVAPLIPEGRPTAEIPTDGLVLQGTQVLLAPTASDPVTRTPSPVDQTPSLAAPARALPLHEDVSLPPSPAQMVGVTAGSYTAASASSPPSAPVGPVHASQPFASAFSASSADVSTGDLGIVLPGSSGTLKDASGSLASTLGGDSPSPGSSLPGPTGGPVTSPMAPTGPVLAAAQLLTAPSTPVPAPSVPALLAQVAHSPGQVRIALSPEGLGTVLVQVSSTPQGLSVVVSASEQAISAIGRQAVLDSLAQAGVPTSRVDFIATSNSPTQSSGQDSPGSQPDGGREQSNSDRGAERQFEDTRDDSAPAFSLPELPNQPDLEEQE